MLASAILAIMLTIPSAPREPMTLVPGDGVVLDSVAPVSSPIPRPRDFGPGQPPWRPWSYGGSGAAALLFAASISVARRKRRPDDPLYVVVHGNGGSASDFDELLASLGATRENTVAFDYRTVVSARTSTAASKVVPTDLAARELDRLIRRLSADHSNIYSIHHSKGGAIGAAMIASLDDGSMPAIDGYRGAALLDPAIASGVMGSLQRAGRIATWIPDNGGFDPVRCDDERCWDIRENLGKASGVEVIAVRNPDAVITNFTDEPAGLRIFDLVDDGGSSALLAPFGIIGFRRRVSEAHRSVLTHQAVANCVKAEVAQPSSCVWKGDRKRQAIRGWSGSSGSTR